LPIPKGGVTWGGRRRGGGAGLAYRSPQLNTIPLQFSQISLHLRHTSAVLPQ